MKVVLRGLLALEWRTEFDVRNYEYAVLVQKVCGRDGSRAMEAAELMKITSHQLLQMEIVTRY